MKLIQKKTSRLCIILLFSFVLPSLWMALIFAEKNIFPGGKVTVLTYDMREQYLTFFASLRYVGKGDNSFFINWSRSMGGNYLGLLAYYMASPLSWITVFFTLENLPTALYILYLLKIGLCGLNFAIFLLFGNFGERRSFLIIAFSSCYALMSYNMMYGMCLMWLDGVVLLPLILLGIEKILEGQKGGIYLASITSLFICNYYISYMVGIFAAIYIVFRLGSAITRDTWRSKVGVLKNFLITTLLAAGIAMPLLLPAVRDLLVGELAVAGTRTEEKIFNFPLFSIFKKFLSSQYDSISNEEGLPSLFCGTIILLLVFCFFFQKKKKAREKVGALLIILFFLCSFWICKLDTAWHGFLVPDCYPYRYAFLLSTFLIILAYRAFLEIKIKQGLTRVICLLCTIFTYFELFFNGSVVTGGIHLECHYLLLQVYEDSISGTKPWIEWIQKQDDGFYRIEKDYQFTDNDAMLFGYNGLGHFSSTYHNGVNEFTRKMGLKQYDITTSGVGSTLLTDSLLGVKYHLNTKRIPDNWQLLSGNEEVSVYQNPDALSVAYMVSDGCMDKEIEWSDNPFVNQNLLLQRMTGTEKKLFEPVSYQTAKTEDGYLFSFLTDSDGPVYIYIMGDVASYFKETTFQTRKPSNVYVNGEFIGSYFEEKAWYNMYLGQFSCGDEISVELETEVEVTGAFLCQMNMAVYEEGMEYLKNGELQLDSHSSGRLTGVVTANQNQVLFTSIPYDEGYHIKVDGKDIAACEFSNAFLVIPLQEGSHYIEITYISPGFVEGCLIAAVSLVVSGFYFHKRKRTGREGKNAQTI